MNKPTNPNLSLPTEFATNGVKTDFSASKISDGFDRLQPDVLPGDCLNKFIDDTYKGLNYAIAGTDAVNLIEEGEVLSVESGTLTSTKIIGLPTQSTATATQYLMSNGTNAEWTDFTGANQKLSNLDADGNQKIHALKGYLDNGTLLTDTEGLSDVNYYAHSTFDADKFTTSASWSGTITQDGIASGFSGSAKLQTTTFNPVNKSWQIELAFKLNTLPTSQEFILTQYQNNVVVYVGANNKLIVRVHAGSWDNDTVLDKDTTISTNINYKVILGFTQTGYYAKLINLDTNTTIYSYTNTNTGVVYDGGISKLTLGNHNTNNTFPFTSGSIDLKQFSVIVDGVPVFSGNKTGIDTIKPDDYTVTGTPAITDDGIASGFSTSKYIQGNNFNANKPFEIFVKVKTGMVASITQDILDTYGTNATGFILRVSDARVLVINPDETTYSSANLTANTDYLFKITYNGTNNLKVYLSANNGTSFTLIADKTITTAFSTTQPTFLGIRGASTKANPWGGSIDLNAFKIYVDGDLVYQPCLKIPYTESKTGSKVVDSYYRDRVTDMYNQFGYAPYYTLSDSDFTLPMGELYGLINKVEENVTEKIDTHDKAHIVDIFTSGSTWGRIYSDGFKMQGGVIYGSATTESIPSPTLTENGTAGGNSIAVISDSERSVSYKTYYAIDGNTTSQWIPDTNAWANHWWGIYFPNPVTFTKIEWLRRSGETNNFLITGKIEYSSDGSNWTKLEDISPSGQSGDNTHYQTVTISNTGTYAKYWRIYCLTGNGGCGFREISFYRDSSTKGLIQQVQGVSAIVFPEPFSSASYSYSLDGLGGTATASTVTATGINLGTITGTQVAWMASGY